MTVFSSEIESKITKKLKILYGDQAEKTSKELIDLFNRYSNIFNNKTEKRKEEVNKNLKFTKRDVILNTYANSIKGNRKSPLEALYHFSNKYLSNFVNGIHVLPFYCWDTDRGFSVLDYYNVDPRNGTWEQFSLLGNVFDVIMVDVVLNHASIDNPIVQKALIGDPNFQNFVICYDLDEKPADEILLKVTRARPTPVLTQYYVYNEKEKHIATFDKPQINLIIKSGWIWTTFSRPNNVDGTVATKQVDLNFQNPKLFLEFVNIILFYISKGVNWIRLDAVGYLWKNIGTTCLHLPETHLVIELLTMIFSALKKENIVLISEVNEPQDRALQYLGSSSVYESDMIYLFTHYPLAIHAVLTGTAKYYTKWLPSLTKAKGRLFVSVLGTHDGMGMKPIGNWLPESEKEQLQRILVDKHGALPNYAKIPGGKKIIYELCSTTWNFVNKIDSSDPIDIQINRYFVVFALGLLLRGVPSIYINGLLGITNYDGDLDENRTINREILDEKNIDSNLGDTGAIMSEIIDRMKKLILIRQNESAFDLDGSFTVLNLNEHVVSMILFSSTQKERIISFVNVSNSTRKVKIKKKDLILENSTLTDLILEKEYKIPLNDDSIEFILLPYQIIWLQ
jgi:sucrose phosphorylase